MCRTRSGRFFMNPAFFFSFLFFFLIKERLQEGPKKTAQSPSVNLQPLSVTLQLPSVTLCRCRRLPSNGHCPPAISDHPNMVERRVTRFSSFFFFFFGESECALDLSGLDRIQRDFVRLGFWRGLMLNPIKHNPKPFLSTFPTLSPHIMPFRLLRA